jgi:hypothetical protein
MSKYTNTNDTSSFKINIEEAEPILIETFPRDEFLSEKHRRVPCGELPCTTVSDTCWDLYPALTDRLFLQDLEHAGHDAFQAWDSSSLMEPSGQAVDLFLQEVLGGASELKGKIPITHPSLDFMLPEDLFSREAFMPLIEYHSGALSQKFMDDCKSFKGDKDTDTSSFYFLIHWLADELDLDYEELRFFQPSYRMITPESVHSLVPLSLWYQLHEQRGTMGSVYHAISFPIRTLVLYNLAIGFLGNNNPTWRGELFETAQAKPVPWFSLPQAVADRISKQKFVVRECPASPYYISVESPDRLAIPFNKLYLPETALYLIIDNYITVIIPWYARYVPSFTSSSKRICVNLSSVGRFSFVLALCGFFSNIIPAEAVTDAKEQSNHTMYWIMFTVLFQLLITLFPSLNPIKASSSDEFPDLETAIPAATPLSYHAYRPKKKQDPLAVRVSPPKKAPWSDTIEKLKLKRLVAGVKFMGQYRSYTGQKVVNKEERHDSEVAFAILTEAKKDPVFKGWVLEHVSKRNIPMAWLPNEFVGEVQRYHVDNHKELIAHFKPSEWRHRVSNAVDLSRNLVKARTQGKIELPIPTTSTILEYAGHPATDLILLCQRLVLTNWANNTTPLAKVSIGIDVSVVLLKIWKIIPKTRHEWAKLAISAVFPGWNWQDPQPEKSEPHWISDLIQYNGDWSSARSATKMVILRVLAFGATLPTLWSSFADKETWTDGIFTFCARHKSSNNITMILDAMFDMFESACLMCGLGPKSACFDDKVKPAEMAYSEVVSRLQNVVAGNSSVTLFELEADLNSTLQMFESLRDHSKGLPQERHVTDRITALNTQITRVHGMIDSGGKHYDTKFYGFSGAQGIGKSTALECIHALCMSAIGEVPRIGHIVEDDAFDSGLTPFQNCLQGDDIGKTAEKFMKQPAGAILIRFGTNAATPLLSPIAENKGFNHSHHKLGAFSGNIRGMGITRGLTFWKAAARRLTEFEMQIVKERSIEVDGHWEPIDEYRRAIPEPYNCVFRRVYFDSDADDNAVDFKVHDDVLEWDQVKEYIRDSFVRHHRKQLSLMNSSVDRSFCVHNTYLTNCPICGKTTQDSYCRRVVSDYAVGVFDDIFVGPLASMKELSQEERLRCKVDNFIVSIFFAFLCSLSLFLTQNHFAGLMCALVACRCLIYSVLHSYAELATAYDQLPVEELVVYAKENKSLGAFPILGTMTLAGALMMVSAWRNLRPQDGEAVVIPENTSPDAFTETNQELDKPDNEFVLDEEAKALIQEMEDYKSGEKPYMTVEEQKRQRAKAAVVSQFVTNYWNVPLSSACISSAGSGTTDEHICDIVASQMWGQIHRYKDSKGATMEKRRVVWNLRPDYVCMTGHGFDELPDRAILTYVRGSQMRTLTLDKSVAKRGPPGTDYVFVYVGALSGTSKSMFRYMTPNIKEVKGSAGKIVYFNWATCRAVSGSCILSVLPNKTETISPWDNPLDLKGVINATLEMRSYDGLCGAIYITNRTVVGFHTFGVSGPIGYNNSGGSIFDRSLVEECFKHEPAFPDFSGPKLDYHSAKVKLAEAHPKNPANYCYMGPLEVYSHVERNATPRSEYRENPYCEVYEKLLGIPLKGTFNRPKDSFNRIANKMINVCVSNRGNPPKSLIDKAVELFLKDVDVVVQKALEKQPMLLKHPMSTHQVINGIAGHPYAHGINEAKSSSFPRFTSKRDMLEGEHPNRRLKPEEERDLVDCERSIMRGETTGCVGNVLRKDQPMPPGKDDRGFCGCSAELQIAATKRIGPIMHVMQEACHYFCHVIGIDPGSSEWEDFQSRYDCCDEDKFVSIDFSQYDLTHPEELKNGFVVVMSRVGKALGYSEEECREVELICHEMEHMYVNFGGPIVWMNSLWPSGVPPTAQGGSIKTILMLIAACVDQWGDVDDIREELVMAALGDDNTFAFKKTCERVFDVDRFTKFYVDGGMWATPDSKAGTITFINRSDVRFLKRESWFHPDLGRRVGKLDMTSLTRPLVMCRKNQSMHQCMIDIVNSSAREACLHGYQFYKLLTAAHRELFAREEWVVPPVLDLEYEDYIEIMTMRDGTKYRRVLEFQDGDEMPASEEVGVREIVEPDAPSQDVGDRAYERDPTTRRTIDSEKDLPSYVEREIFISTTTMTSDTFISLSFQPLTEIMETSAIAQRFASYHAFAFDIVVRFAVSGTKFDYGRFIASYMYNPAILDYQNEKGSIAKSHHIGLMSQRPHVQFDIGQDEEAELTIPFFYHHAMLPLTKAAVDSYVDVRLESVTPPRSAMEDTPSNPTLSIYARLSNITVMGHTTLTYQDEVQTPVEGKSRPSIILAKIARAAGMISAMFPMVAPAGEAVAAVAGGASGVARAFGYSTPMEVGGASYVAFASPPTANANVDRAGRVLSMDVHQSVALHPNVGGSGHEDQMSIESLVSKKTIINAASIPRNSNGINSPWLTCNVTPAMAFNSLGGWFVPPSGLVSMFRNYWHGTMCYTIDIVTTGLTGGKLLLAYNANSRAPVSDTHTLENVVWDLKATHTMTFRFEWHQYRNWLRTFDEPRLSDPFVDAYDDGRHNGSWSISTLQPIVGTKADQSIDFIVTAWMENPRFANPSYGTMSSHRIFNMPNIPTGDTLVDSAEVAGPGGNSPLTDTNPPTLEDLADGLTGGLVSRRPVTGLIGAFDVPFSRRRRRRYVRRFGILGLGQVPSNLPTPAPPTPPTGTPAPTAFPSRSPTHVPTVSAVTNPPTRLPTRGPSGQPIMSTLFPTAALTAAPSVSACNVYPAQVDPEMLGAPDLFRTGGQWKTAATTLTVRTLAYSSDTDGAYVEVLTDVVPLTLPANGVIIPGGFRLSGAVGQKIDSMNGTVTFASQATVQGVTISMAGGSGVREYTPSEMGTLYGWTTGTETVDGQIVAYAEAPAGATFTPPPQTLLAECDGGAFSFATFLYDGELFGPSDSPRVQTFRSRRWGGATLSMEAIQTTRIYSMYIVEVGPNFQGDVTANEAEFVKTFGQPQILHNEIVSLHMGEDLLSLRQDLKVFREAGEFVVTPAEREASYQAHLHASPSGLLGPYELLTNCFAGIRGGMTAWYRLHGEGYARLQRGLKFHTSTGAVDQDFQRGFEYADTRINPTIVVSYPWFSQARFEYARNAFTGTELNIRHVEATNTGSADLTIVESLSVKEDFDLVRFMGCPILL